MTISDQTAIELRERHGRLHQEAQQNPGLCDEARIEHDAIAAEMVKRGEETIHESPLICRVPNYGAAHYGDPQCVNCIFSLPGNICGLYNFGYIPNYSCDSWHPFSELALQNPHGYLIWKGKQKAIASPEPISLGPYVIKTEDEAFGIAHLGEAAQMNLEAFEAKSWADQHCILPRERRLFWPEARKFHVYPIEKWIGFEKPFLIEDGKLQAFPQISRKQRDLIRQSKDLPKQIPLIDGVISISESGEVYFEKGLADDNKELKAILEATYEQEISFGQKQQNGAVPIYSLALVRDPRMLPISKKNVKQVDIGDDMPWEVRKRGEEYCVIKVDDGEVEGCHETEGAAEDQIIALNIAEAGKDQGDAEDMPSPEDPPSLVEKIRAAITELLDFFNSSKGAADDWPIDLGSKSGIAQKTVDGQLWHIAWSSNAFKDRDGEIFSTDGLERYVERNEANEEKGLFNFWHINPENSGLNTDFAVKKWQGVIGRFLIEAGPYLPDERGEAAKAFFGQHPQGHPVIAPAGWGASVEFRYLPEERKSGTFETFWIDKTSILSRLSAANIWTNSAQNEVKDMALSDEQKQAFTVVFGEDALKDLVQQAEDKTAELEQLTDYKEAGEEEQVAQQPEEEQTAEETATQPEEEQPEGEGAEEPVAVEVNVDELAKSLAKQFQLDTAPLVEELKGINENMASLQERIAALEANKAIESRVETPRYTVALTRASEAQQTAIPAEEAAKLKPKETAPVGAADIWSQTFSG